MIVCEEKKQVDTSQKINIIEDINYDWVLTILHSSPLLLTKIESFLTNQHIWYLIWSLKRALHCVVQQNLYHIVYEKYSNMSMCYSTS